MGSCARNRAARGNRHRGLRIRSGVDVSPSILATEEKEDYRGLVPAPFLGVVAEDKSPGAHLVEFFVGDRVACRFCHERLHEFGALDGSDRNFILNSPGLARRFLPLRVLLYCKLLFFDLF